MARYLAVGVGLVLIVSAGIAGERSEALDDVPRVAVVCRSVDQRADRNRRMALARNAQN